MKINAVILAEKSNTSNWLGTSRSLHKKGVPVIRITSKRWYNSNTCSSILAPNIVKNQASFLNYLKKLGSKTSSQDVLFPSGDTSLMLISKDKSSLEKDFIPIASDWDVTKIVLDKGKTFENAKRLKISVPVTFIPGDIEDVKKIGRDIKYPCLLKPAHSHIFLQKNNDKLLRINSKQDLIMNYTHFSRKGYKMIIQEEISGNDDSIYSFNAVFSNASEPLAIFLGQKIRQFPPHFGAGSLTRSVWNMELAELGVRLLKGIGFSGIAGVEFKKDEKTGSFKLLEINGRSWSWNYLATFCGLNFPYIAYLDATGDKQKPLDKINCKYKLGLEWLDIAYDFNSFIRMKRTAELTLREWFCSVLPHKKTYAYLSLRDPLPFMSELDNRLIGNRLRYFKKQLCHD